MNEFLQGRLTINDRKESVEGGRWEFTFPPNCNLAQNIVSYEIFSRLSKYCYCNNNNRYCSG